jgi:antitoxin (DNA-binding transcriptional repressor) of toxin-antitoxin stability system
MNIQSDIKLVNMHEAKSQLSRLVQEVLDGHRVRIARNGKPVVELKIIDDDVIRVPGTMAGKIWVSEDFDDYTPDIQQLFEGTDEDELPN